MREDIQSFPPPHDAGALLGHDGTLTPEEVIHLQSLGYVVAHYKSFSGSKLVQAYFEGLAKGLIGLEAQTFKSMDTIRKQLSKLEAGDSDLKAPDRTERVDIISALRNKNVIESEPAARRRGRPPGT